MSAKNEEIEILIKKMMKDLEGFPQTDEIYQEDMKDFEGEIKLQWKMFGILAYQIFGKDNYSYKFGEELDDPSVTFEILDKDLAIKFLKCEPFEFGYKFETNKFELTYIEGWIVEDGDKGESDRTKQSRPFLNAQINPEAGLHPFMFSKLPMFRDWTKARTAGHKEFGAYIPINKSLGSFENQILPMKIFKHFIDKASQVVVRDCPCRINRDCKDHSHSLGCMMMGDATFNMAFPKDNRGRVVNKEDALEFVRQAVDNGLIPVLGRLTMEAEGYDVTDTEHFMSVCFCCSCCCINGRVAQNVSVGVSNMFTRIEGLTVEVDEDVCTGCGDCMEVCVFKGMEMIDDIARVNQKRCLGCGRCESTCPSNAISIELSDSSQVDELIAILEDHVDVTPQSN